MDQAVVPASDDDDVVLRAHLARARSLDRVTAGFVTRPCRERASILIIARPDKIPVTARSAVTGRRGRITRSTSADRNRRTRENVSALREPELPRVVGLLRGLRVRGAPRARVQRDPQRRGDDRHLAALQVPHLRQGRDAAGRPDRHAGPAQGRRRARSSTRPGATSTARSSTTARSRGWPRTSTAGRRRIRACAGSSRTRWGSTSRSRTSPTRSRRSRCRARPRAACSRRSPRPTSRTSSTSRSPPGKIAGVPGRHLPHRLHGRPRLRDLDSLEGRRQGLGRADGRRARPSTSTPPACWRSTSRASRPGCS